MADVGTDLFRQRMGRTHIPDPNLPRPSYDWVYDPFGWAVNTMCGVVLRRCQKTGSTDQLCRSCEHKSSKA